MIEKPDLPPEKIRKLNELCVFLTGTYRTKAEIQSEFGITNERTARELVSMIAKRRPVVATSDNRGYKVAKYLSEADEVEHSLNEIQSRIDELEERKAPLIRFLEKAKEIKQ